MLPEDFTLLGPGMLIGRLKYDKSPTTPKRNTVVVGDVHDDDGPVGDEYLVPEAEVIRIGDDLALFNNRSVIALVESDGSYTPRNSAKLRIIEQYDEPDTGQFASNVMKAYVVTGGGEFVVDDIVMVMCDGVYWIDDSYVLVRTAPSSFLDDMKRKPLLRNSVALPD